MRIRKQNDIYIFFETIEKAEPGSILDAGMFLKRVGSISRQMMNREVSGDVCMDGIEFFPETTFPVWENLYDHIYSWEEFLQRQKENQYELGIILGIDDLRQEVNGELIPVMKNCCQYLLLDGLTEEEIELIDNKNIRNIKIEGDVYYFIDSRDEWIPEFMS